MDIIKIEAETYLDIVPEEYGITYLGESLDIVKALEGTKYVFENRGESVPEWSEMVRNWLGSEAKVNGLVKELQEYYIHEEDLGYYETLEDFFFEDPEYFIAEIIDNTEKAFEFFEANDIQFGTVGYSPWSYFIAPMYYENSSFVQDLWEGWYFYSVSLIDENGEVKDSVCEVYIPDTEPLKDVVKGYFGLKDFYLVDNEEASYMDVKKVREIEKIERSYKII